MENNWNTILLQAKYCNILQTWVKKSLDFFFVLKARLLQAFKSTGLYLMALSIRIKRCLPASVFTRESPLSPQRHTDQRDWESGIHMGFEHNEVLGVWCASSLCVYPLTRPMPPSTEALATAEQWQQETGRATNTGTQYTRDTEQTQGVKRGESHVR